ncbi:MAG: SDR family oxidoreductase [Polyangiaceae bacterium]
MKSEHEKAAGHSALTTTNGAAPLANGAHAASPVAVANPLDLKSLFDGVNLVVLGGTGFLGKLFWSMLLTEYPNVGRIYLLVRGSKGKTSDARFWEDIAPNHTLDPIREAHGDKFEAFLKEKVHPIDGDTGRPLCGIDDKIIKKIRGTIDAVVNVAGVVDFSPPLDEALDANAFGCQNLVALARALGDVPLMHPSTCDVAGQRPARSTRCTRPEVPFPRAAELGVLVGPGARDRRVPRSHRAGAPPRRRRVPSERVRGASQEEPPRARRAHERPRLRRRVQEGEARFVAGRLISPAPTARSTGAGPTSTRTRRASASRSSLAPACPFCIARPACCESTVKFPFSGWNEGISTSVPMIYLGMKGQVLCPFVTCRSTSSRATPDLRRHGDELGRAPRWEARAPSTSTAPRT